MPDRHVISTSHRIENGGQTTEMIVDLANGPTVRFYGSPGGPYSYDGEGEPPAEAVSALYEFVGKDEIAHKRPTEDEENVGNIDE